MRTEGQTVYVLWYGKVLQGNVVRENDMMGMTAVRIPLQGQHPIALFTPGHVYDTADEAVNSKGSENCPKRTENGGKRSKICRKRSEIFRNEPVRGVQEIPLGQRAQPPQNGFLDEFYSLWKMEHTPHGHIEAPAKEPVPVVGTKQCTKAAAKRQAEIIQLSLFD